MGSSRERARSNGQILKLMIPSPTLLTEETSYRLDDDPLVPDDRGSCKRPPPGCRRMVIRLRYGIKGRCDRRTTSTGEHAWCTYTRISP